MNNYKVLFSLRVLKYILDDFVGNFLVLYFFQLSNNNILPIGIYNLIFVTTVFVVIFSLRNWSKSKHRINLLRIGIIWDFIFFLSIIILKEKIIDYIYLIGFLYGLEEGFYYSVYNMFETDGVSNEDRAKFTGTYFALKSIFSIVFPLIFGSFIYQKGFIHSISIIIIIIVLRMIISFFYKDENLPSNNKINLKEYKQIVKRDIRIKQAYHVDFYNGFIYSSGAFSSIITIYIISIFSNSFSLGIFTSIFAVITCILGILFARFIKPKHYEKIIKISTAFTLISLISMIVKCNAITVIMFNFFQTFSKNLVDLINGNSKSNICNISTIRKEYKVEYWLGIEFSLFLGRSIGQCLFILMSFAIDKIIIFIGIFIILFILYTAHSIKLQKIIKEEPILDEYRD